MSANFVRDAWYPVALSREVSSQPLARTVLNEPLAIYRTSSGEPAVIGDLCPHRFASLSGGHLVGDELQCPYHGLRFGPDGTCTFNPHGDVIPPHAKVLSWPVREDGGVVWAWPGRDAPAEGPPDFRQHLGDARFAEVSGYLQVHADYRLVMDNLMDLSHVEYLHPFLSGGGDGRTVRDNGATFEYRVEQAGNRISALHRYTRNPVSPFFRAIWPDAPESGQLLADMHWHPATVLLFDLRMTHEDGKPGVRVPAAHLLVPASASETHYFWFAWRDSLLDMPEVDAEMAAGFEHAFMHEDEPMIAKVWRNMAGRELMEMNPVILPNDNAAIRVRRLLAKLAAPQG